MSNRYLALPVLGILPYPKSKILLVKRKFVFQGLTSVQNLALFSLEQDSPCNTKIHFSCQSKILFVCRKIISCHWSLLGISLPKPSAVTLGSLSFTVFTKMKGNRMVFYRSVIVKKIADFCVLCEQIPLFLSPTYK